jgi:hypothetical protein
MWVFAITWHPSSDQMKFSNMWPFFTFSNRCPMTSLTYTSNDVTLVRECFWSNHGKGTRPDSRWWVLDDKYWTSIWVLHIYIYEIFYTLITVPFEPTFHDLFSSPCQRQCEFLPSLGIRRLMEKGQDQIPDDGFLMTNMLMYLIVTVDKILLCLGVSSTLADPNPNVNLTKPNLNRNPNLNPYPNLSAFTDVIISNHGPILG